MADEERLQGEAASAEAASQQAADPNSAVDGGASAADGAATQLESGTYEIIRGRLNSHGQDLRKRLGTLNDGRKQAFGSIETALLGTERITTEHN